MKGIGVDSTECLNEQHCTAEDETRSSAQTSDSYNVELMYSIKRDCELTTQNYSNMQRRFSNENRFNSFLLVYYSIVSIVNDLVPRFFDLPSNVDTNLEFINIVFSIVFLYLALEIGFSNYGERSNSLAHAVSKLKFFSKELKKYKDGVSLAEYKQLTESYQKIIDGIEIVPRIDFYRTCKAKEADQIKERFSFFERLFLHFSTLFKITLNFFAIISPIVLYIYLFYSLQ